VILHHALSLSLHAALPIWRSLGWHWNSLNQGEQQQFVEAFTQWQLTYYGKTVRSSARETVQFRREVQDGQDVYVESRIVTRYGEDRKSTRLNSSHEWISYA